MTRVLLTWRALLAIAFLWLCTHWIVDCQQEVSPIIDSTADEEHLLALRIQQSESPLSALFSQEYLVNSVLPLYCTISPSPADALVCELEIPSDLRHSSLVLPTSQEHMLLHVSLTITPEDLFVRPLQMLLRTIPLFLCSSRSNCHLDNWSVVVRGIVSFAEAVAHVYRFEDLFHDLQTMNFAMLQRVAWKERLGVGFGLDSDLGSGEGSGSTAHRPVKRSIAVGNAINRVSELPFALTSAMETSAMDIGSASETLSTSGNATRVIVQALEHNLVSTGDNHLFRTRDNIHWHSISSSELLKHDRHNAFYTREEFETRAFQDKVYSVVSPSFTVVLTTTFPALLNISYGNNERLTLDTNEEHRWLIKTLLRQWYFPEDVMRQWLVNELHDIEQAFVGPAAAAAAAASTADRSNSTSDGVATAEAKIEVVIVMYIAHAWQSVVEEICIEEKAKMQQQLWAMGSTVNHRIEVFCVLQTLHSESTATAEKGTTAVVELHVSNDANDSVPESSNDQSHSSSSTDAKIPSDFRLSLPTSLRHWDKSTLQLHLDITARDARGLAIHVLQSRSSKSRATAATATASEHLKSRAEGNLDAASEFYFFFDITFDPSVLQWYRDSLQSTRRPLHSHVYRKAFLLGMLRPLLFHGLLPGFGVSFAHCSEPQRSPSSSSEDERSPLFLKFADMPRSFAITGTLLAMLSTSAGEHRDDSVPFFLAANSVAENNWLLARTLSSFDSSYCVAERVLVLSDREKDASRGTSRTAESTSLYSFLSNAEAAQWKVHEASHLRKTRQWLCAHLLQSVYRFPQANTHKALVLMQSRDRDCQSLYEWIPMGMALPSPCAFQSIRQLVNNEIALEERGSGSSSSMKAKLSKDDLVTEASTSSSASSTTSTSTSSSLSSGAPRIAIITAIYGRQRYERTLKPFALQTLSTDFICFTDNHEFLRDDKRNGWIVDVAPYHLEALQEDIHTATHFNSTSFLRDFSTANLSFPHNSFVNNQHPFNIAKYYKTRFHRIPRLQVYDVVIWIDGTIFITNHQTSFLMYNLFREYPQEVVAIFEHSRNGSLKAEVEVSLLMPKYNRAAWLGELQPLQNISAQLERYEQPDIGLTSDVWQSAQALRPQYGLWCTCFVAFNMNHRQSSTLLEHWYQEIKHTTTQDQVSIVKVSHALQVFPYSLPDENVFGNSDFNTLFYKTEHFQ